MLDRNHLRKEGYSGSQLEETLLIVAARWLVSAVRRQREG